MKQPKPKFWIKTVSVILIINLLIEPLMPSAMAMSNGPTQPEATGFTPASVAEMVDPFTGDFTYNIPLLDVEGYPINLSYAAGVGTEEEASWVGLGWMLNPGVVNRSVRGLPDDFSGDQIKTEKNMKPNRTIGGGVGLSNEIFGFEFLSAGISVGIDYNNYNGFGANFGFTPLQVSLGSSGQFNGKLGINSSSNGGFTLQPSVSFPAKIQSSAGSGLEGLGISTSFNRRSGLTNVSISPQISSQSRLVQLAQRSQGFNVNLALSSELPQVNSDYKNKAFSGQFTLGLAIFGFHPDTRFSAYFSTQKLAESTTNSPSYGYMYLENATNDKTDLLDYLRRKEFGYATTPPALPTSTQTYDLFNVSGQGVSGSFRPYRNSLGEGGRNISKTFSENASIGVELGGTPPNFHVGTNIELIETIAKSGKWLSENIMENSINYSGPVVNSSYEKLYFKEANEKSALLSSSHLESLAGTKPIRAKLDKSNNFHVIATDHTETSNATDNGMINSLVTDQKVSKNKLFQYFTKGEVQANVGSELLPTNVSSAASAHHISEIDITNEDGSRYIFGLPTYNTIKEEVTFAVGKNLFSGSIPNVDHSQELVEYSTGQDTPVGNDMGLDNAVNKVTTPAFASSYLLTSVLGNDYVDSDGQKGPTDGDIGNFVKFNYLKFASNHKWRSPYTAQSGRASYDPGLRTDTHDDKGTYVYGEKELWYLDKVISKNYIAVFALNTDVRLDGYEAAGRGGGRSSNTANQLRSLSRIDLYGRKDYEENGVAAVPIKSVHFEYDYSLCPGVPSNASGTGKLTLKKVYFTYRNSNRGKYNAYAFSYANAATVYNRLNSDRWGTYINNTGSGASIQSDPSTSRFPFSTQTTADANTNAATWNLNKIKTPTGATIDITYESDSYGFVQHNQAERMYKLTNASGGDFELTQNLGSLEFDFEFDNPSDQIADYQLHIGKMIYGSFLVKFDGQDAEKSEYVPGYFKVVSISQGQSGHGRIKFENTTVNDNGGSSISPISKAALQFGRLHLSRTIYNPTLLNNEDGFTLNLIQAFAGSIVSVLEAFQSPNQTILNYGKCKIAKSGQCWVRMIVPDGEKHGGGYRVSKVLMSDGWDAMSNGQENGSYYGKKYNYVKENGRCSGVAQNEPAMGTEESPLTFPVYSEEKNLLAPDNRFYMEGPFGDELFPNPTVGYSRVVVEDFTEADQDNLNADRHGTGSTVHEFYTAREFPTFHSRTELDGQRDRTHPLSLSSLLGINVRDFVTYSQGFVVETNDMHGKQKRVSQYSEADPNTAIKYTEYVYKKEPVSFEQSNVSRLVNGQIRTIDENGEIRNEDNIGLFYEVYTDSHSEHSLTVGPSFNINIDGFLIPIPLPPFVAYLVVPSVSGGSFTSEEKQFRYITMMKEIKRFGILENVIEYNEGTITESENLAYDRNTGEALVTRTTNNFDDNYYTLSYPAYWYFKGMGAASKTAGNRFGALYASNGFVTLANAENLVAAGDEFVVSNGMRYWITEVGVNYFRLIKANGLPYFGPLANGKIARSGNRNILGAKMMTIESLINPLTQFSDDIFNGVLTASATEYGNRWKTYCDCFGDGTPEGLDNRNPYLIGHLGKWHSVTDYTYLADRSATDYNRNSNIRRDGIFKTFEPIFRNENNVWGVNKSGWTYVSEMTEYSPEGYPLESRDAIGNYSSSLYAYNRAMQIATATNAEHREIGFMDFEFNNDMDCGNRHLYVDGGAVLSGISHTGDHSIIVYSFPVSSTYDLDNVCPTDDPCILNHTYNQNTLLISNINISTIQFEVLAGNVQVNVASAYDQIIFSNNGLIKLTIYMTEGCVVEKILPVI